MTEDVREHVRRGKLLRRGGGLDAERVGLRPCVEIQTPLFICPVSPATLS